MITHETSISSVYLTSSIWLFVGSLRHPMKVKQHLFGLEAILG